MISTMVSKDHVDEDYLFTSINLSIGVKVFLVNTIEGVQWAVKEISRYNVIAIDLEGEDLGRNGALCIIQISTGRNSDVFLFDVCALGHSTFSGYDGITLCNVLENTHIKKLFWDVRGDQSALFHLFGIRVQSAEDLQMWEVATRVIDGQQASYLTGLGHIIQSNKYMGLTDFEKESINVCKSSSRRLFSPQEGGSFSVWRQRPLPDVLIEYCTDTRFLFPLYLALQRKVLIANFGSPQAAMATALAIRRATERRISKACDINSLHAGCSTDGSTSDPTSPHWRQHPQSTTSSTFNGIGVLSPSSHLQDHGSNMRISDTKLIFEINQIVLQWPPLPFERQQKMLVASSAQQVAPTTSTPVLLNSVSIANFDSTISPQNSIIRKINIDEDTHPILSNNIQAPPSKTSSSSSDCKEIMDYSPPLPINIESTITGPEILTNSKQSILPVDYSNESISVKAASLLYKNKVSTKKQNSQLGGISAAVIHRNIDTVFNHNGSTIKNNLQMCNKCKNNGNNKILIENMTHNTNIIKNINSSTKNNLISIIHSSNGLGLGSEAGYLEDDENDSNILDDEEESHFENCSSVSASPPITSIVDADLPFHNSGEDGDICLHNNVVSAVRDCNLFHNKSPNVVSSPSLNNTNKNCVRLSISPSLSYLISKEDPGGLTSATVTTGIPMSSGGTGGAYSIINQTAYKNNTHTGCNNSNGVDLSIESQFKSHNQSNIISNNNTITLSESCPHGNWILSSEDSNVSFNKSHPHSDNIVRNRHNHSDADQMSTLSASSVIDGDISFQPDCKISSIDHLNVNISTHISNNSNLELPVDNASHNVTSANLSHFILQQGIDSNISSKHLKIFSNQNSISGLENKFNNEKTILSSYSSKSGPSPRFSSALAKLSQLSPHFMNSINSNNRPPEPSLHSVPFEPSICLKPANKKALSPCFSPLSDPSSSTSCNINAHQGGQEDHISLQFSWAEKIRLSQFKITSQKNSILNFKKSSHCNNVDSLQKNAIVYNRDINEIHSINLESPSSLKTIVEPFVETTSMRHGLLISSNKHNKFQNVDSEERPIIGDNKATQDLQQFFDRENIQEDEIVEDASSKWKIVKSSSNTLSKNLFTNVCTSTQACSNTQKRNNRKNSMNTRGRKFKNGSTASSTMI